MLGSSWALEVNNVTLKIIQNQILLIPENFSLFTWVLDTIKDY